MMLFDKTKNFNLYKGMNTNLDLIFDYIESHDLHQLHEGKTMITDEVWVNRISYETKDQEDCRYEAHSVYGDVQITLKGCEYLGYAHISDVLATDEYNVERDIIHLNGSCTTLLKVEHEMGAIFFPEDAHMAKINSTHEVIEKVVFKFKV